MTPDIALVLGILLVAIVLFVSERLRVDVVALLVLSALAITGLVTPEQAVAGFSNSAVITVWAIFILSGGLSQTGIATIIGQRVLRISGNHPGRLLVIIMLTSGVLSAFMNNIGVAAMFLPVVLDISRQTGQSPSKLLLPVVYGTLLGGMTTLISTPTNILVSEALAAAGLTPFGMFDFTPAGIILLLGGILFMLLIGQRLLPVHKAEQALAGNGNGDRALYGIEERLAIITLPFDTTLAGKTLAESHIGQALGLNILGLRRGEERHMAPRPDTILAGGDRLLVLGRLDRLDALSHQPNLAIQSTTVALEQLLSPEVGLAEFTVPPDSPFLGQTVVEVGVRQEYGLNVLAIRRHGRPYRTRLQEIPVAVGDHLLLQGPAEKLAAFGDVPGFQPVDSAAAAGYELAGHLLAVSIPAGSTLIGQTLAQSHFANVFGLLVLGLLRQEQTILMPSPDTALAEGDTLIVEGRPRDLDIVRGLQNLTVERNPDIDLAILESDTVALAEAVLSPYTTLANKTLREIQFREKYGLSVLAIWRRGRPYRTGLGDMALRFGDALLLYGPRERLNILGREPDFLVLRGEAQEEPRYNKAPIAGLLMLGVIVVAMLGWLPIAVAAIIGATLMVVTGCLTMDEAYRYIEWKAVFLIAAMLPLGVAMAETGAASFLADVMMGAIGGYGPVVIMAGLFLLTLAATQFMPNPVVAVLMAPITLTAAQSAGISPYPLMMSLAFASSASILTPVGHAANVLVMGPGGYRFADYVKVGLPLSLVLLVLTLLVVPLFWPF